MSAGIVLAGAPSSRMIRVAAPSVYRKVTAVSICRGASHQRAFEMLEWSDAKVSRAVLGGQGGGNAACYPTESLLGAVLACAAFQIKFGHTAQPT